LNPKPLIVEVMNRTFWTRMYRLKVTSDNIAVLLVDGRLPFAADFVQVPICLGFGNIRLLCGRGCARLNEEGMDDAGQVFLGGCEPLWKTRSSMPNLLYSGR